MIHVNEKNAEDVARVMERFAAVFALGEVKFKPQMVKNNRALALAYISARAVMDKLDEVVGITCWRDEYTLLPTGEVECRLSVRIAGEWITKADVGSQSEQPDTGDRMKAAYSDALKRAAVKFGIGRFLYRTTNAWHDYDPQKKQFAYELALTPELKIVQAPAQKPAPGSAPKADPAPAQPAKPGPPLRAADNMPLRARLAQAYGSVKNHSGYLAAGNDVLAAINKGELSKADIESLRKIAADTHAKLATPHKQ